MTKTTRLTLILSITFTLFVLLILFETAINNRTGEFDGQRAFENVVVQVDFGPRINGSVAHENTIKWISTTLSRLEWEVEIQETITSGYKIQNIIAKRGNGVPWIIIGSHYDSRPFADNDPNPENRNQPVLGANDGASSVAILMELARVLSRRLDKQVWLVFFDAEDISANELTLGSQYFVDELNGKPNSVVILDMVGDKDLNIYMEWNSNPELNQEIWGVASDLGYTQFIPVYKHAVLDDHTPFLNAGIRAVDIIDFDYPSWHSIHDTIDKISAESLEAVGKTILKWIEVFPQN